MITGAVIPISINLSKKYASSSNIAVAHSFDGKKSAKRQNTDCEAKIKTFRHLKKTHLWNGELKLLHQRQSDMSLSSMPNMRRYINSVLMKTHYENHVGAL